MHILLFWAFEHTPVFLPLVAVSVVDIVVPHITAISAFVRVCLEVNIHPVILKSRHRNETFTTILAPKLFLII